MLQKAGLGFNALLKPTSQAPEPEICNECGDSRQYVFYAGHWRKTACECERIARLAHEQEVQRSAWKQQAILSAYSWLGDGYGSPSLSQKTLATFKVSLQSSAYQKIQAYLEHPVGSLVIHGAWGTGKTHLLAAIIDAFLEQDIQARFAFMLELFEVLQKTTNLDEIRRLKHILKTAKLLALDDIDKVPSTQTRNNLYQEILDARLNAALPTIFSCNTFTQIEDYLGVGAHERIKPGLVNIATTGKSYRER